METLTKTCQEEIMSFMVEAHRQTTAAHAIPQATWRDGSFSKVLHTLKLAYAAHLNNCLNNHWADKHARSVRDLADVIKAKLNRCCNADAAHRGTEDLQATLEHLQDEFRWQTCANVFTACAQKARSNAETSYGKALQAEKRLRGRRARATE